jgi:ACS family glucarate transporter-like MFS transporter
MNQTLAARVRWKVLAWLCSLSALTYITRIGIIQVQDRIELDLHLTPQRLAYALSAFSLAYALFEMPSGWLGDKLGPRKVLIRIVLVWTAFTALTGLAWGLISLIVFRFLFGAGEAGAFPNISRASREWFPFSERGFTQGMVWMCARWGGAVAPLLMMVLAYPFGWRGGFVLMSVLGAVWVWAFQARYKDSPQSDPAVNAAERALILEGRKDAGKPAPLSWMTMLRSPTLWCLSVMYLCSNAGWSFFTSWITPYLRHDLRLSGIELVLASGAPLFFGGASCLLGGFLTDRQVRLWGPRWGRTLQGVIAYGLGGVFMLVSVALTPSHIGLAFASLCLSSFVKDFGMASSWATTIDIGHRYSGTVAVRESQAGHRVCARGRRGGRARELNYPRDHQLLKRACACLRADAVVIAAVTGNSDGTNDLVVHDERNAAFERNAARQAQNAQSGPATGDHILKCLARSLEAHRCAGFLDRDVRASNLGIIHFLVVHQGAAGIDHRNRHLPVAFPRLL